MSIYVEILIRGPLDEVWRLTQTPDLHARWDLRFTEIEYLPQSSGDDEPQRFLYATRIGFGMKIQGEGESIGRRDGRHGERASSLKFHSEDPKSLIREGAGYWRYAPTDGGVRFLTSYDYQTRFGAAGRVFDAVVFRPLMGWATAWSFDRLRLWIERGIDPASSMRLALIHAIARATIAAVWLYQGVVPKLLGPHADELEMIRQAGVSSATAPTAIQAIGCVEVVFGLAVLVLFHQRWPLFATLALMIVATVAVALNSPGFLVAAFNPISLNLLLAAMACVGLAVGRDLPSARRCLRRPPEARS